MDIEFCRGFITLARCLNFTEAAAKLNITQPALSKRMLALEKELGTCLLERNRKGVSLTDTGRMFFENASVIVSEFDKGKAAIKQAQERKPVRIVGDLDEPDVSVMLSMIAILARQSFDAVLFDRTSANPLGAVVDGGADVYIGFTVPDRLEELGLAYGVFTAASLLAVVRKDHDLAQKEAVTWHDLKDQTFVQFVGEKTDRSFDQIEEACLHAGFSPKKREVPAENSVEFFGSPLMDNVLVWKKSQREVDVLLQMGQRAGIPIQDENNCLTAYFAYRPENAERLERFLTYSKEVRQQLGS